MGLHEVGAEALQFPCLTVVMVPGGEDFEPYTVSRVDSGAGISGVGEAIVRGLRATFPASILSVLTRVGSNG